MRFSIMIDLQFMNKLEVLKNKYFFLFFFFREKY